MKKLLLLVLCFSKVYFTNAQSEITKKEVSEQGEIKFVEFNPNVKKYRMDNFEPVMKQMLEMIQLDELRLVESVKDEIGYEHKTYQQYLNGVKVEFTRREIKILSLASEGYLNKEIADNLNIAEKTVKRHRQNCMLKLGIKGKQAMNRFLMKFKEWYATKVA